MPTHQHLVPHEKVRHGRRQVVKRREKYREQAQQRSLDIKLRSLVPLRLKPC